jgi:hypothetical protein
MYATSESKNNPVNKNRPFGVWVLTPIVLIFFGLLPLSQEPYYLLMGYTDMINMDHAPIIIFGAWMNLGFIAASVFAWKGVEIGRVAIWVLITIYLESAVIMNFRPLFTTSILQDPGSWIEQGFFMLLPVIFIWYFNKRSTREFYKKS